MKEQWSISKNQLAALEEGLYQEKQECIKKIEYKTSCCTRCIPCLRLIFLLQVTFFFGWGCYMILQTYRPRVMENEATSITPERHPTMFESLFEIQKSHPSTEMPVIFVKPEVIIDKLNNFLEGMKLNKEQNLMQNKAIVTNVEVQTQNSSNVQSKNIVGLNVVNRLLATLSSGNLVRDEKVMKSSVPEKFSPFRYIDKDISTDKNKESIRHAQFLEKLRDISRGCERKATNLEKFEDGIDFIKNDDRLTLKSQENHALDASNKLESLELVVTTISNPENFVDHTISVDLTNILQDLKPKLSDLIKDVVQDDHSENNSLLDETNERVSAGLEYPYLVMCAPYESHEFSDISVKDSSKDSDSQPIPAQEISEQIENGSSDDIDERNEDKQDINNSDMSMSVPSDASASRNQDRFAWPSIGVQNIKEQHSLESIANIKEDVKYESAETENPYKLWFSQPTVQDDVESSTPNVDIFQWFNMPPRVADLGRGDISKSSEMQSSLFWDTHEDMNVDDVIPGLERIANIKEDEKYESTETENPYKLWFSQPTVQDDVKSSTPNVDKFQWFNMPLRVADLGRGDISKSSEMQSSLFWDTYEDMNVDDVIPGSQCKITIKMGILKVKCPTIKLDEEWNLTSSKIPKADVPKVTNLEDILNVYHTECKEDATEQLGVENISNENFDKEVTMSQDNVPKIISAIDLQESTTSAKISNDALLDLSDATYIDPFDSREINQDFTYYDSSFYNSNEKEAVTTVSSSISEFSSSIIDSNEEQNPFFDIFDARQQEQLKMSKEQDYSVPDNTETSLKNFGHFYALEKEMNFRFKNEIANIMTQYLPKNFDENNYRHNICSIFRYMRSLSQHPWGEQYVALRQVLEYIRSLNMDDHYHRKKRMTDDLTWQQDQVSNTLDEDDKNVDLLENLRKMYQKMEILALYIDRLHERYLLHNKLDDDYASSEFPMETEERRELYTPSRIVYEK